MTSIPEDSLRLGPIRVLRASLEETAGLAISALESPDSSLALAFCNSHTAEIALRDPEFATALARFVVVNDGIGLEIAGRLLEGRGFPENLNGTDFTPFLFGCLTRPTRVYLIGAAAGVAEEAARRFAARFPNLVVVGVRDGYFDPAQEPRIVEEIAAARPDILMVALGNPKQELFIARNFDRLNARVMLGVGALFDFTAGRVERAPGWVRKARLEWAFRLAQEPRRLMRRYTIEAGGFLLSVLRMRLSETRAGR
jgi:beta-1,4-glucosyltransferase